ncbi:MAG: YaaA family protein [Micromonosporaceae bacterium]
MLVLLPPSETKADGGDGPSLDLDALSYPTLTPVRRKLLDALVELADDVPASLAALKLSDRQVAEVERNRRLRASPTAPALARYTGVLYDALDLAGLRRPQRQRAETRLAVASALFGVVRGTDPIPAYRLSGGSVLPSVGALTGVWRPALEPVLGGLDELVVDLRSAPYAGLARIPGAVAVRVVDGERQVAISHHNKAHKGRLARVLATTPREPADVRALVRTARRAGLTLVSTGERTLDLVV